MIRGLYGDDFIHNLVVRYDGESYQLRLHVHDNVWCPIVISMQTDDQDAFLAYICEELRTRQIHRSEYLKVKLEDGCNKGEERF